jgi:glycosyltransferase involved in cell wall biosynthesis
MQKELEDPGLSNKIRILFLAQLPPPVYGVTAVSEQMLELFRAQPGSEVECKSVGFSSGLQDLGRRKGRKLLTLALTTVELLLRRALGKQPFDIAYLAFGPRTSAALRDALVASCARLIARRVLVHVHGEGLPEMLRGRDIRDKILRRLVRNCEIVAVRESMARIVAPFGCFSKIWYLPNCVPDPGVPSSRTGCAPLQIGYVAHLQRSKGIVILLRALEELANKKIAFHAHIIGGSAELTVDEVRSMVDASGLRPLVTVHGALYGEQKRRILAQTDVFAYPSLNDHFPLFIIEALALGVVPIVCDKGGPPEVIGPALRRNALPIGSGERFIAARFADRLAYYAIDRAALGCDSGIARQRYLEAFQPSRLADAVSKILTQAAESRFRYRKFRSSLNSS